MTGAGDAEPWEEWFRIDAVRGDLRGRSVRSGIFALGARLAQGLLGVLGVMVLARILSPADFGVLAMVLPLVFLYNGIANLGLQNAVMHEEILDHWKASAMFRSAAVTNLGLAALFFLSGPLLARLYGDARASGVAMVWAGGLYILALSAIHEALLKRQLRFFSVLTMRVTGMAVGIIAAIIAAALGAGYWSLLLQWVAMDLFRAGGMWWLCRWRPALEAREGGRESTGGMREYWRNVAGFRVLNWFAMHPDRILVGRLGGATMLGLYDSSRRWAFYPSMQLFQSLTDVAVATFSRVTGDPQRYRAIVLRGTLPVLALPLPAIAFVFLDTRNVILVLLGQQWLDAIPFVRLMCVGAFFGTLSRLTQWLYLSRGDTRRQLQWAMYAQTPAMLAAVLIGTNWGAIGVAAGFATGTALLTIPAILFCLRGSPVRVRDFAAASARPTLGALTAAAVLGLVRGLLPGFGSALPDMLLRLAVFGAVYAAAWLGLPGGRRDAAEALDVLKEMRRRSAEVPVAEEAMDST